MELTKLGNNETQVIVGGWAVLFSYNTPVAAKSAARIIRTNKKWSITTSKHINKWLGDLKDKAEVVPQDYLDNLVNPSSNVAQKL